MVGRSLPASQGMYLGRAKAVTGSGGDLLQSKDCNRLSPGSVTAEAKVIAGSF